MADKTRVIVWSLAGLVGIGILVSARLLSSKSTLSEAEKASLKTAPVDLSPPQSPQSSGKDGWYVTKEGYTATPTEAKLDKMIDLAASGDKAAFNKMIVNGEAIALKSGVKVHLEKCFGFACSKVEIRPEGSTESVFTIREAIRD